MVLAEIPEGVRVVKTYRAHSNSKDGPYTLLECHHQGPMTVLRFDQVCCNRPTAGGECCGEPEPEPFRMCAMCKGDENTTKHFSLPVLMLARVDPEALKTQQAVLF